LSFVQKEMPHTIAGCLPTIDGSWLQAEIRAGGL
jgi:hypothetical protein